MSHIPGRTRTSTKSSGLATGRFRLPRPPRKSPVAAGITLQTAVASGDGGPRPARSAAAARKRRSRARRGGRIRGLLVAGPRFSGAVGARLGVQLGSWVRRPVLPRFPPRPGSAASRRGGGDSEPGGAERVNPRGRNHTSGSDATSSARWPAGRGARRAGAGEVRGGRGAPRPVWRGSESRRGESSAGIRGCSKGDLGGGRASRRPRSCAPRGSSARRRLPGGGGRWRRRRPPRGDPGGSPRR